MPKQRAVNLGNTSNGHNRETGIVYAKIVRQIATGELSPGQRLVEADLARSFGMSRTPIREVLFQLEKDGLVQRNHHQGARVAAFTPDDIEQIYEIRSALECLAIRKGIRNIELSVLFELDRKLESLRNKVGSGRSNTLYEIDIQIHELIASSCKSQRLISNLEKLSLIIHSVRLLSHGSDQDFTLSAKEHLEIIRALIRRDSETAERLMAEHIEGAKRRAIEFVQQMGKKNLQEGRRAPGRKKAATA